MGKVELVATTSSVLGVYKLDSSENFDTYMVAMGLPWIVRSIGAGLKPVHTYR
jgi:hypothetical protein